MDHTANEKLFFDQLLRNPKIEMEWIDLMSQLEFVGCRKIMKSVGFSEMSVSTLKHLSEEARHSYLLKKAVEEEGLPCRVWSEGLFASVGWNYFSKLDGEISRLQPVRSYPAVSWVIETRVLTFYPWFQERCTFPKVRRVLGQILAEERTHAQFFAEIPFSDSEKGQMLRAEQQLWDKLIERSSAIIQDL